MGGLVTALTFKMWVDDRMKTARQREHGTGKREREIHTINIYKCLFLDTLTVVTA